MNHKIVDFIDIRKSLRKNEVWRDVDFSDIIGEQLSLPNQGSQPVREVHCSIPNLQTLRYTIENGFVHNIPNSDNGGVIICSLNDAMSRYPDKVALVFDKCCTSSNPYLEYNSKHYTDGIFVYVPDNTVVEMPIQIMSLTDSEIPLFLQNRNLVYVGKNSRVSIINCDDSFNEKSGFANNVTEIYIDANASVQHYKMQNLNDLTGLLNHTYVSMREGASFSSVFTTLNGGYIRNHCEVSMLGEHCNVQVNGLYLNDKHQRVENYVYVDHAKPNCKSSELFKGILDDVSRAVFNGHVLVRDKAVKTEAVQTSRNILLTDKALVNARPFLEIYNDDVKCSHGSTVGQLDESALFYICSRGISERTARTLMLYAFCDEVIQKIELEALRDRLCDMVKKRLHGELTVCSECALNCSSPCNGEVYFPIDVSKL